MHKNLTRSLELLAPAKNRDCGVKAINCGADAVYIATHKFGARKEAGNSLTDIEHLIGYAHRYSAKVYITINTILTDSEIEEARSLIYKLYDIGADSIIIQDMGLLETDLPPIPLFASTQTHNNTPQKIKFLEDVGFRRAILARELPLDDIRQIREATSIDLECFVHGALCVSFSGQCYMSYAIGGRSGNRGECAQPCRKKYSIISAGGTAISRDKYLLSLRELNLSDYLPDLIDAGVRSFKIEGRLRDEAYVINIVSYYRKKLDAICLGKGFERSSAGISEIDFVPDPVKTFNRGFTSYFIKGRADVVCSSDTPKYLGEPVGKVKSISKNSFLLDTTTELHNGDGICFFNEDISLSGTNINRCDGSAIYPADMSGITKGTMVYRNHDHQFISHLLKADIKRRISVSFSVRCEDNSMYVSIVDENGVSVTGIYEVPHEPAKNIQSVISSIEKQFSKLGDTEFICKNLEIDTQKLFFIPVGRLNAIRRDVICKLQLERQRRYVRQEYHIVKNNVPYVSKMLTFEANVLNSKAEAFYRRHGVEKIEPAAESGIDMHDRKIMTTKLCLKYELGLCLKDPKNQTSLEEPLYLVDEKGKRYKLNFNCDVCVMEIFF